MCSSWSAPVFLASLFFAFSLAPSLLPRPAMVQGLLSGISLAVGYGIGVFVVWLWAYVQLPGLSAAWQRRLGMASAGTGALIVLFFLWKSSVWQNTVRELLGMEPMESSGMLSLVIVAALVFGLLLLIAGLFKKVLTIFFRFLHRFLPPRLSVLIGLALTILVFWSAIDGLLVRSVLRMANASFQQLDAWIEPD
jgi:uncharacterized membrane protein